MNGTDTFNIDNVTSNEVAIILVGMIPLAPAVGVMKIALEGEIGALTLIDKRINAQVAVFEERAADNPGLRPVYNEIIPHLQEASTALTDAVIQAQAEIERIEDLEETTAQMLDEFGPQLVEEAERSAELGSAVSQLNDMQADTTDEGRRSFMEEMEEIFATFEDISFNTEEPESFQDSLQSPAKRRRLDDLRLQLEEATKLHREAGNPFARVSMAVEEAQENVEQALDQVSTPVGHSLVQLNCGGTTISTETKPDGSYILSGNVRQGVDCSLLMVDVENKVFPSTGVALRASSITPTVDLIVTQPLKEIVSGDRVEGRLGEVGELDMYTLDAAPKQRVFFDLQSQNGLSQVVWQLFDSNGDQVFSQRLYEGDAGSITLELGGAYILVVGHQGLNQSGIYRFQVWDVPAPNKFAIAIGDVISDGRPGPGAGNIETSGVFDGYTFDAAPGQEVFSDLQGQTALRQLNWQLLDRNGDRIFLRDMYQGDAGTITLELGGTYTLWVGQEGEDETGTYQFQLVAK